MSTPITAGMPLSVQNPTVKWVFEPTVMSRSRVVEAVEEWGSVLDTGPCLGLYQFLTRR